MVLNTVRRACFSLLARDHQATPFVAEILAMNQVMAILFEVEEAKSVLRTMCIGKYHRYYIMWANDKDSGDDPLSSHKNSYRSPYPFYFLV